MNTADYTTIILNSYVDVIKCMEKDLGPTPAGKVRVYRGQTKEFKNESLQRVSLLPVFARPNSKPTYDPTWTLGVTKTVGRAVWNLHERYYGTDFIHEAEETLFRFEETEAVWVPSLVQHYGPGSPYLDVTSDLDIALWFSLHQRHEQLIPFSILQDEENSIPACLYMAWYTGLAAPPNEGSMPVVYVFDLEPWGDEEHPLHGQLVDLRSGSSNKKLKMVAGQLVRWATRLHRQSACLIYSDIQNPKGPDLSSKIAAVVKLAVDFDWLSVPSMSCSTEDIFPPPEQDPVYKALLKLPFSIKFNTPNGLKLEHPLVIPCYSLHSLDYSDHLQEGIRPYRSLAGNLSPPFFYPYLFEDPITGELQVNGKIYRFQDATKFVLEAPVWAITPSVDSDRWWIQSSLPLGISDVIEKLQTYNVYVELSALDTHYIHCEEGQRSLLLRGFWVLRAGRDYVVRLNYQLDDAGDELPRTVNLTYEAQKGIFEFKRSNIGSRVSDEWRRIELHALKALFFTLTLLRDLSPGFKPPSLHTHRIDFNPVMAMARGKRLDILYQSSYYLPFSLAEPQMAKVEHMQFSSVTYLVPKTLDGTSYKCSRKVPANTAWPEDLDDVLEPFLDDIRDTDYLDFYEGAKHLYYDGHEDWDWGQACKEAVQMAIKEKGSMGRMYKQLSLLL